jgi:hypothetical protein
MTTIHGTTASGNPATWHGRYEIDLPQLAVLAELYRNGGDLDDWDRADEEQYAVVIDEALLDRKLSYDDPRGQECWYQLAFLVPNKDKTTSTLGLVLPCVVASEIRWARVSSERNHIDDFRVSPAIWQRSGPTSSAPASSSA